MLNPFAVGAAGNPQLVSVSTNLGSIVAFCQDGQVPTTITTSSGATASGTCLIDPADNDTTVAATCPAASSTIGISWCCFI